MPRIRQEAATGHDCIVPGCAGEGRNRLGVRCRVAHHGPGPFPAKGRASGLWSPDAEAYLCDEHALGGAHMTLLFEPTTSQETTIKVVATRTVDERTTPIKQPPPA
ncbi:MAG: hypothetical protein ACXVZW_07410 [Gaiellaceae bacterium]